MYINGRRADDETLLVDNADVVTILKISKGSAVHVPTPPRLPGPSLLTARLAVGFYTDHTMFRRLVVVLASLAIRPFAQDVSFNLFLGPGLFTCRSQVNSELEQSKCLQFV